MNGTAGVGTEAVAKVAKGASSRECLVGEGTRMMSLGTKAAGDIGVITPSCISGIGVVHGQFLVSNIFSLQTINGLVRYHGDHHRFWGFLTRNHSLMDLGRQKREHARHERERERRRRLRRLRDEGLAIRLGASHIEEIPRSSSSRRSRHHRHHGGHRTEVLVSN